MTEASKRIPGDALPIVSQFSWEVPISLGMTDIRAALRELSRPCEPGDRIKAAIGRAARRAGLAYWRAFDIWYGKARRIEDHERARIADALEKKRREAARNELHELRLRIAKLETLIERSTTDRDR
jgi:hypothetical protein